MLFLLISDERGRLRQTDMLPTRGNYHVWSRLVIWRIVVLLMSIPKKCRKHNLVTF